MQVPKQTMSVSASLTADMARIKQGGKRGAIAAEAAARKGDLEIPDVPKSEDDLQVIGALPACWAVDMNTHGTMVPMCQVLLAESLRALLSTCRGGNQGQPAV